MRFSILFTSFLVAISLSTIYAQNTSTNSLFSEENILPPKIPWKGKSESLIVSPTHKWITMAEASNFRFSPGYEETVKWLGQLVASSKILQMVSTGKSANGRDIWMVIATKEKSFTPDALAKSNKPLLLFQAGIHSGEIDGKDAGMMLLRDIVHGSKNNLLDHVNLLFIPILSVDAHENSSAYTRINQRGPEIMGWRTNAKNQNLNRDYAKLDTKEVQAVVNVINKYDPDLYLDIHVTDGVDYQYDITYGFMGLHGYSPTISAWLSKSFSPFIDKELEKMGHIPGPLIFPVNWIDFKDGMEDASGGPRFSTAYGDLRHLPSILMENHSLKPFKQRVLGTYVFLEAAIKCLAKEQVVLKEAILLDRKSRPEDVALGWQRSDQDPENITIKGIKSQRIKSEVTGQEYVQWLGQPENINTRYYLNNKPSATASRPKAYWVPAAWPEVIERIKMHGLKMDTVTTATEIEVEMYRIEEPKLGTTAFEGHVTVDGKPIVEKHKITYAPGSVRISTDQPLGNLLMLLLEPKSADSFFQVGFFNEILQQTEYAEAYVMEPLAKKMLQYDAALKAEFEKKLKEDVEFAKNPRLILLWFYGKTPYFDKNWRLYPVGREI